MNGGKTVVKYDLSGIWKYELDPEDIGINECWQNKPLRNKGFKLPGTTNSNEVGEALAMEPVINKDSVRCLRAKYNYVGAAWYQREFSVPMGWKDKKVELFLERVLEQSTVWIDGNEIGTRDSLSTAHSYDITSYITPGKIQTLTIRVDNRDKLKLGTYSHSYTDETQTIWNGIIGKIEMQCMDKIYIKDIKVFSDINKKQVDIKLMVCNESGSASEVEISMDIISSINERDKHNIKPVEYKGFLPEGETSFEFKYELGDEARLWDEFSPYVYKLKVNLAAEACNTKFYHNKSMNFGLKELKVEGNHFILNNRKVYLRGTLECCIHPLTGYPPTNVDTWNKIFTTIKEYGLNHVRFHSWCPPEAAFTAADRAGLYLLIEGPVWLDTWIIPVGAHPEHYSYLPEEAQRIIEAYGNHPSFCFFSNGNELNGDFNLLHNIIEKLREINPQILYTLTSNYDRPLDKEDDFFISVAAEEIRIRGNSFKDIMAESTTLDYSKAVEARSSVPLVSHEIGQFAVYPSMEEISKYTGIIRPINFEAIKNDLMEKNMLDKAENFTLASGKLALQLYKEEIEAALRTKDFGGFQLLGLQDFPGQCTATVGLLNSFWESKGLTTPEEFKSFCGCTVPLLRMDKRIYKNTDIFDAEIEIAHFGAVDFENSEVKWTISDDVNTLFSGVFTHKTIPAGAKTLLGNIRDVKLIAIEKPSKLTITVSIVGTAYGNCWHIWVYPEFSDYERTIATAKEQILITNDFNSDVEQKLEAGGKVLVLPTEGSFTNMIIYQGKFYPVFWSPVFFDSNDPCGIYCNNHHPIFKNFPTEFYSSYQWKNLLENSVSVSLDKLPSDYEAIVEVIPNYYTNQRLANIFEIKVGKGKLFVCSIDLEKLQSERIESQALKTGILNYMISEDFNPKYSLSIEEVRSLFVGKENIIEDKEQKITESFIKEDDI
jgi:hypothetical protein